MRTRQQILNHSCRVYGTLLSLYPDRFRARFSAEMIQIFRDCVNDQHGVPSLVFCVRMLMDLAFSLPREWRREVWSLDVNLDYTGLADAFMITVVVGTNLIGWGAAGAAFAVGLTGIMEYSQSAATVLLGIMTVPIAAIIGILSAVIVARVSRVECNRITA